jgi:extracellular factor (EF) 3-hydroxypalmitic acid methyl ester biosynthesis protein
MTGVIADGCGFCRWNGMTGKGLKLSANDWVLLRTKAVRCTYRLGEEIIREGDLLDSLYIIRRGEASVELAGTGSRTIVATLQANDICGEMAFLEQTRASAAVIARDTEVEVEKIKTDELREILGMFPGFAARFYLSLALILSQRLKLTSRELAREMRLRDQPQGEPQANSINR